jgi:ribosomal protein L37AE/L43A
MYEELRVNGIVCKTTSIDGKCYVIIDDRPCKLFNVWVKNKGFPNNRRQMLKAKVECQYCGKEFLGFLQSTLKYCSKKCGSKVNLNVNKRKIGVIVNPKLKLFATTKLNNLIRDKKIARPNSCSCCLIGCVPDAHHADYKKPEEVIWLCRSCHKKLHHGHKEIIGEKVVYNEVLA